MCVVGNPKDTMTPSVGLFVRHRLLSWAVAETCNYFWAKIIRGGWAADPSTKARCPDQSDSRPERWLSAQSESVWCNCGAHRENLDWLYLSNIVILALAAVHYPLRCCMSTTSCISAAWKFVFCQSCAISFLKSLCQRRVCAPVRPGERWPRKSTAQEKANRS